MVIVNGDITEAYDSLPNSITIGNNCGEDYFMNIYYNGDLYLKGDVYIQNAVVTVFGDVYWNGYNIYWNCNNSDLIEEPTLSVNTENIKDFTVYPNPTNGIFYVKTDLTYSINIYDIQGKYITNQPDLRSFPSAVYLVEIKIDNRKLTKKIIKL